MKKTMQNILAQNSNLQIAYLCGKCGREVEKEALVCPNCGAKLGKIICPFCKFRGRITDFKYDTCPKCGRKSGERGIVKKAPDNAGRRNIGLTKNMFWLLFLILTAGLIALLLIIAYNFELLK
jgi:uncharacterized membrane protein YvbJ